MLHLQLKFLGLIFPVLKSQHSPSRIMIFSILALELGPFIEYNLEVSVWNYLFCTYTYSFISTTALHLGKVVVNMGVIEKLESFR